MDLRFDIKKASVYKSPSQIARVLTEDWAANNLYCPSCERARLGAAPGNTTVFDFTCDNCRENYQLKSQRAPLRDKVLDSAYAPMIDSIKRNKAPNLLLLHYDPEGYSAENLILIPRYFLSPSCIEARKPLSPSARRAGWIGCYILLKHLPPYGRIQIIKDKRIVDQSEVRLTYNRFRFLSERRSDLRGWAADILKVVNELGKKDFCLEEIYSFESYLSKLHPDNKHIRPKIRQQLQFLRDRGILKFNRKGRYSLI